MNKAKLFLKDFFLSLGFICAAAVLILLAFKAFWFLMDIVYKFSVGNVWIGLLVVGLPTAIVLSIFAAWGSTYEVQESEEEEDKKGYWLMDMTAFAKEGSGKLDYTHAVGLFEDQKILESVMDELTDKYQRSVGATQIPIIRSKDDPELKTSLVVFEKFLEDLEGKDEP